jgi:hypothetical protein
MSQHRTSEEDRITQRSCKQRQARQWCPVSSEVVRVQDKHLIYVANMASYVISSSLILVIHDNMINGTNHIV